MASKAEQQKKNQQRLETEAIRHRKELLVQNDYIRGENEYSESHPDAMGSDDPLGKGTGVSMGIAPLPGESQSKAISYSVVNTKQGGGLYDIEGRMGIGGRVRMLTMNLYNEENSYGIDSIDTTQNVLEGQYVVK